MLIRVTYTDDSFDYVQDSMLDSLIEKGAIAKFMRGSGWVVIGSEPTRQHRPPGTYHGVERRGVTSR